MNEREKKLLILLGFAVFCIANIFAFNAYQKSQKKMEAVLQNGKKEMKEKMAALTQANENVDDWDWWEQNQPIEGTHGSVSAELATYAETSAKRYGLVIKRRPNPLREDLSDLFYFSSAKVKAEVNGRDAEVYRWLTDLQDPKKFRSVTRLAIEPQRDDPTRMNCSLEITQWFLPPAESGEELSATSSE